MSQNRLADVITPVETILQHNHRILILFIKANVTGIPANIPHLIGHFLAVRLITHPRDIGGLFVPIIVSSGDVLESPVDRLILRRADVRGRRPPDREALL